jgi:1-acyl-sn-glycerol-3-phosphate acyltransferase
LSNVTVSSNEPSARTLQIRKAMRGFTRWFLKTMTRSTVAGLEHVPEHGPLLILANHRSTIDSSLILALLPRDTQFVGPGDFKLMFPGDLIIKWYGLIPVKRSLQLERSSLKAMTDILKSGQMLGLFPEGGTWEKPLTDAKTGAAYLSMTTGAPILPIGLGGTYQSWYQVARFQRPKLTMNIGEVIPAIESPADKSKRGEVLEAATREIMQRIYDLLPPADQAWYDDQARRQFELSVEVQRMSATEIVVVDGGEVLAELLLKPNLLSPLLNNARLNGAKLPLGPLVHQTHDGKRGTPFPPDLFEKAFSALQEVLHGSFAGYMEYRLGEDKSRSLYAALATLLTICQNPSVKQMALIPSSKVI